MRVFIFTLFCWLLVAVCEPARSQPQLAINDQIDRMAISYADQNFFSGSLLVADDGEVFKKGYGIANQAWEIPNTPQTRFQIASLTKPFTSLLILQMAEDGILSIDDPLFIHLPDFPADYGADITINHLLTHTSGIPNFTDFEDWPDSTSRIETRATEFVKQIAKKELEFDPGTRFSYSNSNYYLLGVIIEKITAKSYGRVLQEQILEPGRLNNSGYRFDRMVVEKMASGYERLTNGIYEKAPFQSPSTAYSASGMYSTVEDLYRWDQLLYTDRLLSERYREEMFTPRRNNYGYGWVIGEIYPDEAGQFFKSPFNYGFVNRMGADNRYRTIWNWGSNPGFNSLLVRIPEERWTIIILENQSLMGDPEGTRIFDMAGEIFQMLDENR